MAWMAAAQAGGSILDYIGKQQALGMQQQQIDAARRNTDVQGELTAEQLRLQQQTLMDQWKLATAGQTDVYGNKLIFDPNTNSWVTATSPQGQALINRSDAIQRENDVRALTQGKTEQDINYSRRLQEGAAASPILMQLARGYGAPTKEGVVGNQKVAAATGAGEQADIARGGITAAALRTGGNLGDVTAGSLDRSGATGLRTALAQDYSPIYEEMKAGYNANRLNEYNPLAARASNTGNIPFSASPLPGSLNSDLTARAAGAKTSVIPASYPGYNINAANKSLIDAIGNYKSPQYGAMFGNLATAAGDLYKSIFGKSGDSSDPWGPGGWENSSYNPGAYNNWTF